MDAILEKFTGKIDAKAVITMVEDIKREYLGDGLQKEDIPPIVGKLVTNTAKFTLLEGPQKKKLVIGLLYHLIEEIDPGDKDTLFETVLKAMVPPLIDGFATMLKTKKVVSNAFWCCGKPN